MPAPASIDSYERKNRTREEELCVLRHFIHKAELHISQLVAALAFSNVQAPHAFALAAVAAEREVRTGCCCP